MKFKVFLALQLVLLPLSGILAQYQDCKSAQILCTKDSVVVPIVSGFGTAENVVNGTCFAQGEHQSHWFTFFATSSGTFEFIIESINNQADYDFILYEDGCSGDPNVKTKACNWIGSVVAPPYLPTGVSSDPASQFNEIYNLEIEPTITISAGKVYNLLVDNISNNGVGFILRMKGTAQIGNPVLNKSSGVFCNQNDGDLGQIIVVGKDSVAGSVLYFNNLNDANNNNNILTSLIVSKSGNYIIKKVTPHNCSSIESISVVIENPMITAKDVFSCGSSSFDLNNAIIVETSGIDLSNSTKTFYKTLSDLDNDQNAIANGLIFASGTYWVKLITKYGCKTSCPIKVNLDAPKATLNGLTYICPNEFVQLPISYNGSWPVDIEIKPSNGPNIAQKLKQGDKIVVQPKQTTQYTILGIQDTTSCNADISGTFEIIVNQVPAVKSINIDCSNGTSNPIVLIQIEKGDTLSYNISGINGVFAGNLFTSVPLFNGTAFNFTVVDANACGTASGQGVAKCDCDPNLKLVVESLKNPSCYGKSDGLIEVSLPNVSNAYKLKWSSGPETNKIDNLPAGSYSVTATLPDGCSTSGTYVLTEPQAIVSGFLIANETCFEQSNGSISISSISGGTQPYTVTIDGTSGVSVPFDLNNLSPGKYAYEIVDANFCDKSWILEVLEAQQFSISIGGLKQSYLQMEPIDAIISGDLNQIQSLLWTSNLNVNCTTCNGVSLMAEKNGYLAVRAFNQKGCVAKDSLSFEVSPLVKSNVFIPNVFSPNGDGVNEKFIPYLDDIQLVSGTMRVYNRWGGMVYEEVWAGNWGGWDGTTHNHEMDEGVYVYAIQVKLANNSIQEWSGDVQLLR